MLASRCTVVAVAMVVGLLCPTPSSAVPAVPVNEVEAEMDEVNAEDASSRPPSKLLKTLPEDPYEDEDPPYLDMDEDNYLDEEAEEWRRERETYKQYLKDERDKMISDPAYRDEVIEELQEEFPEGHPSMGHDEKALYDLALHLQAQELRVGLLRTRLDEAEERMVRRKRRNIRKMKNIKANELSQEELDRLIGDRPSADEEAQLKRRRRAAFLQREAGSILKLRKAAAMEMDLEKKAKLVASHQKALEDLSNKLGHAPGHLEQLKEVWEKEDGLLGLQFNPKTFFRLHDMNEDQALDDLEIQAIMEMEARDLHHHEGRTDLVAAKEEAHRMAEGMIAEYDENKDGIVDYHEFLTFAESEGFIEDRAWHAVNPEDELLEAMMGKDAKESLTAKELAAFRADPMKWLNKKISI